jgi:hypothetical protein
MLNCMPMYSITWLYGKLISGMRGKEKPNERSGRVWKNLESRYERSYMPWSQHICVDDAARTA